MLSLKGILSLDGSGFELGIKRAQSTARKFSHELGNEATRRIAGFLTLAGAEEGVRRVIEYGSHINDLSDSLNVSSDALQKWNYAVGQSGANVDEVAKFFEHLAVAREKALSGDEGALNAFSQFGINSKKLSSMRLEDIGLAIGNAVKNGDAQQFIASLREVGGKGATNLVAAFKDGLEDGFKNAPIIPPEVISQLDALGDRFTSMGRDLMAGLAPFVAWLGRRINDIVALIQVPLLGLTALKDMATGSSYSEAQEKGKKSLDKIIDDWEKANNPKPKDDQTNGGPMPGKPKRSAPSQDYFADFFNADSNGRGSGQSGLNINSLQQIGARVAFTPLQNDMRSLAIEVRSVGLTLKEYMNYKKQIGKPAPGFNGQSDDMYSGGQF